jgi:hypothetical protein
MDYLTCQTDIRFSVAESKEKDEKFMAFWEEYKDLEDADKNILHATLMAIKARKGDK